MTKPLRRGTRLGKYQLERKLGEGAFSTVWRARDTIEKRRVALKIALPDAAKTWGREALEYEAHVASRLHHPNIVGVRNADWIDGLFTIASDLAEKSLAQYRGARRSAGIGLRMVRDVASGLAYAHSLGVLHRDVKPENILVFEDGRAALADFGASRFAKDATQAYTEAGTLGYMAPEQAYGRPRYASDVFSLGLIAYELLAGVVPSWPFAWPPPEHARFERKVPAPLQPVLKKAANFDPEKRYANAIEFHAAFEKAWAQSWPEARPKPRRRKRASEPTSPLVVEADLFRRRYGGRLDMRVECHRCGGPIAETMSYCPWCGSGENSFREVSAFPLVCPDCERGVLPEWTACPWCYPGRFEGNGKRPRVDRKAERTCTKKGCGGQLRRFMRYCPQCKQKPRRPWSAPELRDRCPRCRWPVSRYFWRYCPWCGRREPRAGTFAVGAGAGSK